jgi:hypothetical protein
MHGLRADIVECVQVPAGVGLCDGLEWTSVPESFLDQDLVQDRAKYLVVYTLSHIYALSR